MATSNNHLFSSQEIQNQSYDDENKVSATLGLGYDGKDVQRAPAAAMAVRKLIVGAITYLAYAAPGTEFTEEAWQARKIDETDPNDVKITWAGGTPNFVHMADDLANLTYT